MRGWNQQLDAAVDVRALAVLRIAMGPIVLLHLSPFLTDAVAGTIYRDTFTLPFWEWYPHLPRLAYVALLWAIAAGAILLSAGLWSRAMAVVVASGVTYNLLLSQTHFHHNRAFLVILLWGLVFLPAGNTVSIDAWQARRSGAALPRTGGTRLALTVLRIEVAIVYLASGISKVIDTDWWGGTVTRLRIVQHQDRLAEVAVPDWVIDVLADPGFQAVAAKAIVMTEIAIGFGLLTRRFRVVAVWLAISFHVAIQFTAAVQVFSFAALAALVIWIDGPSASRDAHGPRWFITSVRALDWTGRFGTHTVDTEIAVRGGGVNATGRRGLTEALSLLPLTFWIGAPLRWIGR